MFLWRSAYALRYVDDMNGAPSKTLPVAAGPRHMAGYDGGSLGVTPRTLGARLAPTGPGVSWSPRLDITSHHGRAAIMDAGEANGADDGRGGGRSDDTDAMGSSSGAAVLPVYPGAPWHLRGHACISAWLVDVARVPPPVPGTRYLRLGQRCLFFAVWARYVPGGTLAYDELATGVLVQNVGVLLPAGTLHHVWVSEFPAAAGGLALWRVPKRMGHFDIGATPADVGFAASLTTQLGPVAALRFKGRFAIPVSLPLRGFVIQAGEGGPLRTRCTARGRLVLGQADWDFARHGPLSFLRGKQPLFSARLIGMRMSFGV
jgi:hypothetical protein